jgi:hypothetical protein
MLLIFNQIHFMILIYNQNHAMRLMKITILIDENEAHLFLCSFHHSKCHCFNFFNFLDGSFFTKQQLYYNVAELLCFQVIGFLLVKLQYVYFQQYQQLHMIYTQTNGTIK